MSDLVRVSCSGLVYLAMDDCLAGVVSRSRRAKGVWFLTPIGGKHKYKSEAESYFSDWDAQLDDAKKQELVLKMPKEKVGMFRDWYLTCQDREVVPLRELGEELVDEEKVLPSRKINYCLDRGFVLSKVTPRVGLDRGEETQYFFDVYHMHTTMTGTDLNGSLRGAARVPESNIRLITRNEANAEKMNRPGLPEHNGKVGDMFKFFGLKSADLDLLVAAQPKEMDVRVYQMTGRSYIGKRLD